MKRNILTALTGILASGGMILAVAVPAAHAMNPGGYFQTTAGNHSGNSWYAQADNWLDFKAVQPSDTSQYDLTCISGPYCATGQVMIQVNTDNSKCLWQNTSVNYNGYPVVTVEPCETSDNHDKWQVPPNWDGSSSAGIVNDETSNSNVWLQFNGLGNPATTNPADGNADQYFHWYSA